MGTIIAIFLGWAGGYRFYKKQYLLGVIYFFTFGLFGIGWIVDIIQSLKPSPAIEQNMQAVPNNFVSENNQTVGFAPVSSTQNNQYVSNRVGTYSFEPTGTRFECRFPIKGFAMRQRVLQKSKVGDPIMLQVYEWEGKNAIAVMNARLGVDLGVAKKTQVSKLVGLLNDYHVTGRILKFTDFDVRNENYLSCEVELEYFEK